MLSYLMIMVNYILVQQYDYNIKWDATNALHTVDGGDIVFDLDSSQKMSIVVPLSGWTRALKLGTGNWNN